MLNPVLNAIGVDISSALKLAISEILLHFHNIVANAAFFIFLQLHPLYFRRDSTLLFIVFRGRGSASSSTCCPPL